MGGAAVAIKITDAKIKLAKVGGACAAVGLIIGIVGTLFFSNYNPVDSKGETASVVFGRIVEQNELVSVSQDYNIVDKQSNASSFFGLFDIPFTGNSFWYRYAGTIKAGVNLETADISEQGNTVTITLDPAYIISNTPNMETSGVLEENNNMLNPIQVGDVDEFQRWCVEQSEAQAVEGGLLDDAQTEAEAQLSQLFYAALGDEVSITYVWRDAPVEAGD
ncbi:hypothetical protein B5F84_05245 [Olsenella sp. An290]|nr:hypothetical protein B5F84_05245 [Olsenella sp. An290]